MLSPVRTQDPNRRRHLRVAVDLDCQLTFTELLVHARVRNLSFGGAQVEMPLNVAGYDFSRLTTLHIRQIGLVGVRWRWSRDHMVGLEFISPDVIRQTLTRFLAARDPRLMLRPIGG